MPAVPKFLRDLPDGCLLSIVGVETLKQGQRSDDALPWRLDTRKVAVMCSSKQRTGEIRAGHGSANQRPEVDGISVTAPG